jgi:PmbA protein
MMIEKIRNILMNIGECAGYKIIEKRIKAAELFFIKKGLDMSRGKEVRRIYVTVYKDFTDNGIEYRGSSMVKLFPAMEDAELKQALAEALFAAGFVKNKYYPLAAPTATKQCLPENGFAGHSLHFRLGEIAEAIFKNDSNAAGFINSCELFLDQIHTRVVNSEGVDVAYEWFRGQAEMITTWQEEQQAVELYKNFLFANFDGAAMAAEVTHMFHLSREKAYARPTPELNKHTVLLTGEPVNTFLHYYVAKADAESVYNRLSEAKPGECIQGVSVKGDLINLRLEPVSDISPLSAPCDEDGFSLDTVVLYEEGVLKRYWGDVRHCHYLGAEPTGLVPNVTVDGGSKTAAEMKQQPYLEIEAFSDFQMDNLTGDFAGEIRLGRYFNGQTTIPVTGGSVSGNIAKVQGEMYLSVEQQRQNRYVTPKTVQLFGVTVTGAGVSPD